MKYKLNLLILLIVLALTSCSGPQEKEADLESKLENESEIQRKVDEYAVFTLTTDVSILTENQKAMIPILIEAAKIMEGLFWQEAYGDREALMNSLGSEAEKHFAEINYGPWDRLRANEPFIDGVGPKPAGAQYYPEDMTKEEFEAWDNPDKSSLYTFIRRDDNGNLITVPFREMFSEEVKSVSALLLEAAELTEDPGLKNYLILRADAILTDNYQESDMAWMDMKV